MNPNEELENMKQARGEYEATPEEILDEEFPVALAKHLWELMKNSLLPLPTTAGQGIEFEDVPDDSKDQWREPCDSRATTPTRGEQLTTAEVSPQVVNSSGKCQYCGMESWDSYTCKACSEGWPYDKCRCENNGDYCDACLEFVEHRRAMYRKQTVSDWLRAQGIFTHAEDL